VHTEGCPIRYEQREDAVDLAGVGLAYRQDLGVIPYPGWEERACNSNPLGETTCSEAALVRLVFDSMYDVRPRFGGRGSNNSTECDPKDAHRRDTRDS
jgi:hypothetical protein